MRRTVISLAVALALVAPAGRAQDLPLTVAQDRSVDPVVLTGAQFPGWSAGPEVTVREPQVANDPAHVQSDCANDTEPDGSQDHSCEGDSRVPRIQSALGIEGAPVSKLLAYQYSDGAWTQIPFQVDERYTRYLTNDASGFALYSGTDQHTTYAFDREGYRFLDNFPYNPSDPAHSVCLAKQRGATGTDPIIGLDDNDELAFMFSDTAEQAPPLTPLPTGIKEAREVAIADPTSPGLVKFAYVMLASDAGGAAAQYDVSNGYVRYVRDADAGMFVYSQSSYGDYGAAPKGPYCNPDGTLASNPPTDQSTWKQRRPKDTAWIYTPRYKFRYEGRWLMTELHVHAATTAAPVELGTSGVLNDNYGADLIDRWKARAFAQDPGSETPCCGYEEEDTNWGGSSILMGERSGPVRTIRETWGADSSTNNARRETFYRDTIVWGDALRVHPIPPLDGIYVQWDYNPDAVTTYYNPTRTEGVAVDGQEDEVFGNFDDPCNTRYDSTTRPDQIDENARQLYRAAGLCAAPYHQSVDVMDPTVSHPNQLQWEQMSGPAGSLVTRWSIRDLTPGTVAHQALAVSYYRDNSCFDDGTGTTPGPKLHLRSADEPSTYTDGTGTHPRTCWKPGDPIDPSFHNLGSGGDREGDERYYQGSVGTTGLHLLTVTESDNAMMTVPLTEIDTEQRIVVLEGNQLNVGERYGRSVEKPLLTVARPFV